MSKRGAATAAAQSLPYRLASRQTYDAGNNPDGLISFATAENRLLESELTAFANTVRFEASQLHYSYSAGGGSRFPAALSTHLNEYLAPHEAITAQDIKVAGSATPLHMLLAWALADPGDGIMTSRPVYGRFELDFGNLAQVGVVYADTQAEECMDVRCVERFEEALVRSREGGVDVKALIMVNPHNPLGRCYPRDTLIAIMKFCQAHSIHLISDEIYACSVFESAEPHVEPFTSALSIDTRGILDRNLLHVTYGLSKDFAVPGLRVGAVITRNEDIHRAIDSVIRFHHPSAASLAIGSAMLEDRSWTRSFISLSRGRLAEAYKHVVRLLRDAGIAYLPGSNAGFFVWIDLSPYLPIALDGEENAEFALAKRLVDAGVFLHPREEHALRPGWFRLVYTQEAAVVEEGLRRIKKAVS